MDFNREISSPTPSSVDSWDGSRKRKSFSEYQRTELEVQMKVAHSQYLASEEQRMYYEQKARQLRVDRLQTPTGFNRSVLKAQMKAADMQMKAADMQMKAADAQYLAAEQQRIYYEQKTKKLRIDRLQSLMNAEDVQPPSIGTFPSSTDGVNIFKKTSNFPSSQMGRAAGDGVARTSGDWTGNGAE